MKKIIGIILTLSLFVSLFSIHTSAASADPYITTPGQYFAYNGKESVTINWNAPTGTVTSYVLNVRHLSASAKYEPTADYLTDPYLIVRMLSLPSGTRSYTIPWSKLAYGSCYRISVCANMSDGSKRWSNEVYFFTATHKVKKFNTISFRFYEGFSLDWKNAIYYAARAWRNVPTGLEYEVVNTYPTTQCHNNNQFILGDGQNRITNTLRDADDRPYLAKTKIRRNSSGVVTEADININSHEYNFTIGAQSGYVDLQAVMTHEMGHVVGMPHCCEDFAVTWTMYFETTDNDISKRSLEVGDKNMFSNIYITI